MKLPIICPSCEAELKVQSLHCDSCQTNINGSFELPVFLKLDLKEQNFIMDFVQTSGSLKVMAQQLNMSYPTVRNMLDDLINKVEKLKNTKS
jgi:hypothetical protein